jgi:hypothetical protein
MASEKKKLEGKKRKLELFQKLEMDRNKSLDSIASRKHSRVQSSNEGSMDNIQIITNKELHFLNDLELTKEVLYILTFRRRRRRSRNIL